MDVLRRLENLAIGIAIKFCFENIKIIHELVTLSSGAIDGLARLYNLLGRFCLWYQIKHSA